ncbi:MAG TPA: aminotransferase class V-fold PLP-dependent enzyme [Methylomirabilota bacterium]|nr:aminotransferase class V-fold PLP-dependent enzyme [Methylomirabilota bacterium]
MKRSRAKRPSAKPPTIQKPAADPALWSLDPDVTFLNHGSFGACPREVVKFQRGIQNRMERQPVRFFVRDLEPLWDRARTDLAAFLGADANGLVFVPNATSGVNTVLRSLECRPGEEWLVTDHEYNACRNALAYAAQRVGARLVVARIPFPLRSEEEVVDAVLRRVTRHTRLALLDHVTSQTGMILPLRRLIAELEARDVETIVDGAHAPGMIPLNLRELNAAYYTGNCHKWLCAPKTAGFLHVREDRRHNVRPLVISHGANSSRIDRSRFLLEFGWMGTWDPSAWVSVPRALRFMESLLSGGWPAIMERNRRLALAGRSVLCEALGIEPPCPDNMIGSLASVPLPDSESIEPPESPLYLDALQEELLARSGIEVPVIPWPAPPKRLLRVSAQLYNSLPQYRRLAAALGRLI